MPPKTVTCSICSTEVLKAQTLARSDGTRACRSHEGVTSEADARQAAERAKLDKAIANAGKPSWLSDPKYLQEQATFSANWEKEAAEYREYIYAHCWACAVEGLEWQDFWTQVLIASKRLELRGEFNFLNYGDDVKKLMGGVRLLAPIKWQDEVTDRAVVKHLYKKVREIVHLLGFMLLCPECCDKHGFKKRLDDLFPKPTWEQMENMSVVMAGVEPVLKALAEKKEGQS